MLNARTRKLRNRTRPLAFDGWELRHLAWRRTAIQPWTPMIVPALQTRCSAWMTM